MLRHQEASWHRAQAAEPKVAEPKVAEPVKAAKSSMFANKAPVVGLLATGLAGLMGRGLLSSGLDLKETRLNQPAPAVDLKPNVSVNGSKDLPVCPENKQCEANHTYSIGFTQKV